MNTKTSRQKSLRHALNFGYGAILVLSFTTTSFAATYSISPNPASVNENAGHLTFTVTRTGSLTAATVYASTVQDQGYNNNGYYTGLLNQTVNFTSGQSTAQVSVTINDLGLTSGSETFRFIIQQSSSDPISTYLATDNFTIVNNDVTTYSISPNPASVNENAGHLTFTVTRTGSLTAATVYASTVQDQGYNNNGYYTGLLNQSVNFTAGQSTAQVSVTINDQGLTSGSEIFRFIVQQSSSDPVSTYLATDNFTIVNNDVTTYSISPNPASVNENAGQLTFTISRTGSLAAATVYASTVQDQGYNNNGYYTGLLNQTVSFTAGQSTAQVSVTISDLGLASGSETFRFIVQQSSSDPVSTYLATDNFTIVNNDVTTYSISPNPASVNENAGQLTFIINRSGSLTAATVYASTVQDQGYVNSHYYVGLLNQALNFTAGQSTAQVSVTISDLGLTSGSETFRFIVQQSASDPVSTYLATDNFTIVNTDAGSGPPGLTMGLDARDTGIAAYAAQIKAAGYSFVGQYIGNEAGYLTSTEAAEIQTAGLQLFSIYEKSGMSDTDANGNHTFAWQTYFSESQGESDASRAYTAATSANQPFGTAIYFAIDLNPGNTSGMTEADALTEIANYFQGLQTYFGSLPNGTSYAIGVYGAGDTLTRIMNGGLARYSWLASPKSWAGFSIWEPPGATSFAWNLHQIQNLPAQPQYGNIQIDTDETSELPFGAWNSGTGSSGGGSAPLISNPSLVGSTFTLSVPTQAGTNYVLEYKNSMSDAAWIPVQTNSGTGGAMTLTNTGATGPSRFYHVRIQ